MVIKAKIAQQHLLWKGFLVSYALVVVAILVLCLTFEVQINSLYYLARVAGSLATLISVISLFFAWKSKPIMFFGELIGPVVCVFLTMLFTYYGKAIFPPIKIF